MWILRTDSRARDWTGVIAARVPRNVKVVRSSSVARQDREITVVRSGWGRVGDAVAAFRAGQHG